MVEEFWFITSLLSTAFVPSSVLEAFKKALVCQIRAAFSPTYFQWHEKKTRDQFRSLAQHITDDDQAFCASFFGDVVVAEHHKCIQPLAEISCGIYNLICYYALAFSWLFLSFLWFQKKRAKRAIISILGVKIWESRINIFSIFNLVSDGGFNSEFASAASCRYNYRMISS